MKTRLFITTGLILIFLSACSQASVLQSTATSTIIPTDTPAPTATPTKLPTITPTPTIEPPSIMAEYLSDVKILSFDPFDHLKNWDFDSQTSHLNNGVFELQGKSFWASSFSPKQKLVGGEGIMLKFKLLMANGQSEFVFNTGSWQTDGFRQFGLYNRKSPKADLFLGKKQLGGIKLIGNLMLQPDTWYEVIMAIDKNGKFLEVIWDPSDESHHIVLNETLGDEWDQKSWYFMPKANEGETLFVDDFYKISFGEIK